MVQIPRMSLSTFNEDCRMLGSRFKNSRVEASAFQGYKQSHVTVRRLLMKGAVAVVLEYPSNALPPPFPRTTMRPYNAFWRTTDVPAGL